MALTQENVHYTLNSGPDVMNKSNRVHARIQEFLSGGGGGGGSRPDGQSSTCFTVYRVDPMVLLQRGGGGPTSSRGCPKKPIQLVIFHGGPDPLTPLWIRTWGRLTPLFAYRIMVYQNLNKSEKYHPTTTKRKKSYLLLVEIASAEPEGGQGVQTPWKITSYMGFYRVYAIGPPWKKLDPPPPGKCWTPSLTLKNISFLRN